MIYDVAGQLKNLTPGPLDALMGPYATLADARIAIPNNDVDGLSYRAGKIVLIGNYSSFLYYAWQGGYLDNNLVKITPTAAEMTAANTAIANAQTSANTGIANAATAQSKADSAFDIGTALQAGRAGVLTSVMANIVAAPYSALNTPNSGRIEATSSGVARARHTPKAYLVNEKETLFYYLLQKSGVAPRLQLSNSAGSTQSGVYDAIPGFNRAVLTAGTAGSWGFGVHSTAASDFELDYILIKGDVLKPENFATGVINAFIMRIMDKLLADSARIGNNENSIATLTAALPVITIADSDTPGGVQLFNKAAAITGTYVDRTTGALVVNANYTRSDYIELSDDITVLYFIRTTNAGFFGAFYDASKVFVASDISAANVTTLTGSFNKPATAKYIRVNISNSLSTATTDKNSFFISKNNVPYQPYFKQMVTKVNGYEIYSSGSGPAPAPVEIKIPTGKGAQFLASQEDDAVFKPTPGATTGLSVTGTVSMSATVNNTNKLSMTGATTVGISTSAIGHRKNYIFKGAVKLVNTNVFYINIANGATKLVEFKFDPVAQTITETISGTVYTPGFNLDMTARRLRYYMFFDVITLKCHLALQYYNPLGSGNVEKQKMYFITDISIASVPNRLNWYTTGAGLVELSDPIVCRPSIMGRGSSIWAGSGDGGLASEYSPYDGFKTVEIYQQQALYWIEQSCGGRRYMMNFAIASGGSPGVLNDLDKALKFMPKVFFTDLGSTNDIQDGVVDEATQNSNYLSIINTVLASGAMLVVMECLPRNVFTTDKAERAKALNLWLAEKSKDLGFALGKVYDDFKDPALVDKIYLPYATDGTHPNTISHHEIYSKNALVALANL